jgi:miniconductance mechanosensitive channel
MERISRFAFDYFISIGLSKNSAEMLNMIVMLLLAVILIFIVEYVARFILVTAFSRFASKTKTKFDDVLVKNKVLRNIAHFIPLYFTLRITPIVFVDFPYFEDVAEKGLDLFVILLTLWIIRSILNALKDFSKAIPHLKDKPINSYIQIFMIFAWIAAIMFAYSYLTGTPIWKFFTVLGAASAVIILIFKDTILGFVASIQVTINDMVRIGDWVTFEKYGADGDVIEITLATVKVQNFDKTITTIPTYALISDSFRNWRGMEDSDGRRIKRAIIINQNTVRYLTDADVSRLKKIQLITNYINKRQADISQYNTENNVKKELLVNGRNLTNLGVFRKYIDSYLSNHPAINKNMLMMVRQLDPTPQGLPVEIYAFSSDKRWKNYEYIVADIFDHLIAAVPYFDLEIFELPNNKLSIQS